MPVKFKGQYQVNPYRSFSLPGDVSPLRYYDNGQLKIGWFGTINQKVHEPVLPCLTRERCEKQSSWPHLCFAPNTSYRSLTSFGFCLWHSGHEVGQHSLCSGDHKNRWFCWKMFYWDLSIWPRHPLYCSDAGSPLPHGGGTGLC